MRRTTSLALAAAALLLAGCGSGGKDTAGGGKQTPPPPASPSSSASSPASPSPSSSVSPPASPSSSVRPPDPTAGGCASRLELKAADSGRTVCVSKGGEVLLTLDGTRARPWKPVEASGGALRGTNAGLVLQPGDATAAYRAIAAGTVRLTSSRPLCAEPTAPGQVSCKGVQEWTVTVTVKS